MAKGFYLKLALSNLNRNRRMLLPYFIASAIMVAIYFLVMTILHSQSVGNLSYGRTIQQLFSIGNVVMTVLILIFMLYINSFLVKGRKKEFGLYGILGLEKRHVARVIVLENLILCSASLLLGVLTGAVFGRLVFMLLLLAFRVVAEGTVYTLPWEAIPRTGMVFGASFVLTTLFNLFQVSMANPIDLLKGGQKGEKKVRFVIPLTLVGFAALSWAYYTSLTVNNPFKAVNIFMFAVLAVILGTHFLFTTGSVLILGLLKKSKGFYYKSRNFIAVSSMIHRMKQNAAGLASICILSTMVLVTVSGSSALFIGQESMLRERFPQDVSIMARQTITPQQLEDMEAVIASLAARHGVEVLNPSSLTFASALMVLKDGELRDPNDYSFQEIINYMIDLTILPLDQYNAVSSQPEVLAEKEILILTDRDRGLPQVIPVGGSVYRVKRVILDSPFSMGKDSFGTTYRANTFIVAADEEAALEIFRGFSGNREAELSRNFTFDVAGSDDACLAFANDLKKELKGAANINYVSDIFNDRIEGYGIMGGLVFLGAFFTILFLTATILLIYFKQISEGYDDKERFAILQKVGMDDLEVKKTIDTQILIVFFLPLLVAFLHLAMAGPMILNLLQVFNLYNTSLTVLSLVTTCIFFTVVYVVVFRLTARTYYGIVKW